MKYFLILAVVFMFAACSGSGIVPKGDGTYAIRKEISRLFSVSADDVRASAYQDAVNLCAGEGKAVETIKLEVTPDSGYTKPGNVFLEFRCK